MNSNVSLPIVSIVIPTYKNRGGLINSIESVLSQDYCGRLEVIVVDDNEPSSIERKNTMALMQKYSTDIRVVYICHDKNKNGAAARNTGIKASKGTFIAFLDDDDVFLSGKIVKQVNYLETHTEFDAVYCLARRKKYGCSQQVVKGNGTREILMLQSNFFTPTLMFRRESLLYINGFDEQFRRHQDYDLMLRFFAAGYSIGCVQEVLVEIGINKGENITNSEELNQLKIFFFEVFQDFIDKEEQITPGFKNKVYAKHYAGVFLSCIKEKNFKMALKILRKYLPKSPSSFVGVIWKSFVVHLK